MNRPNYYFCAERVLWIDHESNYTIGFAFKVDP